VNRYFGAYRSGELKVRGIEARRRDTPKTLRPLPDGDAVAARKGGLDRRARSIVPWCRDIAARYMEAILRREVPPSELVISRNISKVPSEYTSNTLESSAAAQLAERGRELHAGERIGYVITSFRSRSKRRRTTPEDS